MSPYVARCLEVVAASGLDYRLHAMGTTLEGDLYHQVRDVVRRCFEVLDVRTHQLLDQNRLRQGAGRTVG